MPRNYQSPDSIVASRRIAKGKATRGQKDYTSVRSGSGPRRITAVRGTPTITQPQSVKKARRQSSRVLSSLRRVRAARESGPRYGSTFDPDEAASLVRSVGGTKKEARDLSTKIIGESGGRPDAVGHDPGGTTGLGLWQMTTGVGNDDLIAKHGGTKAMLKPKPNARAALELYRGSSNPMGNWYAPSNPPGDPKKVKPKVKPKPRDLKILAKAGVETPDASTSKRPFKKATAKAASAKKASKIINPKWDPDEDGHGETFLAKGISPVVKRWSKKYNVRVGEAKADSGHVSPGHLEQGTATDLYPQEDSERGWDELEKGLKVLENLGFEVGYGTNGVGQAWSNHGRGNHAHVEWVGQGTSDDAIKKLGGLTDAQIRAIEASAGGGGSVSSSGVPASAAPGNQNSRSKAKKGPTPKQRLQKLRKGRAEAAPAEADIAALEERYGSPVV